MITGYYAAVELSAEGRLAVDGSVKGLEMDQQESFEKFKGCAVKVLGVTPDQVTLEARFAEDLDADSLDLVELVMALEDEFGVNVEESELEGVQTVQQAYELVTGKMG